MKRKIWVLEETDKELYISWEENKMATSYAIVGLNNHLNYEKIGNSIDNKYRIQKQELENFIKIRVDYRLEEKGRKEIIIGSTEDIPLQENISYKEIKMSSIHSYRGITISFLEEEIYDKYYLYEKTEDGLSLIVETEDFQVTSNQIKENHTYVVEGLKKLEGNYQVKAKSKEYICHPISPIAKEKTTISIIVPVYNSERFLGRCVDSLLLSTFKDIEILLIDDGSTDNSAKIMDWYQTQYKEVIRTIYKENEGVSYTRNRGIQEATGDYIAFIDNDDFVHPLMYEELYTVAQTNNLDIAIGKTWIRNDQGEHTICLDVKQKNPDYLIYDYEKMLTEKNNCTYDNIFFVAVWNKIIKTSLVKEHPFPKNNFYEDTAFTRMIYSYIDQFGFATKAYYVWDKRLQKTVGTATNTYQKKIGGMISHEYYKEAIFYCFKNGKKERRYFLAYDCAKEAINYIKSVEGSDPRREIATIYEKAILEVNAQENLLKNELVRKDKEVLTYLQNLLRKQEM